MNDNETKKNPRDLNKILLMGRLVANAELRESAAGDPIVGYRLAVNRGGSSQKCDFFNCSCFKRSAIWAKEMIEKGYLKKGQQMYVEGRIVTSSYVNKDGVNVPTIEVAVNEQQLIGFWVKEGEEVEAPTSPEVEKDEVVDPKPVQDDKKVVIEEDDFPYLEVD